MQRINLYRVTISNAYRMSEQGDHFSDRPDNYHDRNYTIDTPGNPERVLVLADGVEHYEGAWGETVLAHPDGDTILISDAILPKGRVIDRKWGTTEAWTA